MQKVNGGFIHGCKQLEGGSIIYYVVESFSVEDDNVGGIGIVKLGEFEKMCAIQEWDCFEGSGFDIDLNKYWFH